MQDVINYLPGTFCWSDLGTTNIKSSINFYTELFSWEVHETHIESWVYTKFTQAKDEIAALYPIVEGQLEKGYPVAWIAYISVNNIDDYADKITQLGGKVLRGPFNVGDQGRTISLKDPTGAIVYLWQAQKHKGAAQINRPGVVTWYELASRDVKKASAFYTRLLGWEALNQIIDGEAYTTFIINGKKIAGMVNLPDNNSQSHWRLYFYVEDCNSTVRRAVKLGAKISQSTTNISGIGDFAALRDPNGVKFAISTRSPQGFN